MPTWPIPSIKELLEPTLNHLGYELYSLDQSGQEKTALRFSLNAEGKVIDVRQREKSLLETFRNVRANGADRDPKTGCRR